ncbi:hypothetical protein BDN72DRAFT_491155 [Pluteus cervinus]|uniref:Uncharacterized protein n=1 Tax=Pluteus cervinus TaxID=181527 RepID=A0ACD3A5E8_9AGAR|nr:hypothetical protein BDN72DRAFT_491155 [Pluteus cervinus]
MLSVQQSSTPPSLSSGRLSPKKSPPTCTITLANASTNHSTYSSIQISVLPFQQPPKHERSSSHPLKPMNRLRPHPLLPVQNVERSINFPPSKISKSDLSSSHPAMPSPIPRQRACSIKAPRRKRAPPTLPIQFAKASATTTDTPVGVKGGSGGNETTSVVPQNAGMTPPPHISGPKPKKPSTELRWGALIQRSVTRGLPVCYCSTDASMTSSPPSSPTKRCSSSYDSYNAQSFRLSQKLYTRLLGKGLETSELISPPPLHRSLSAASLIAGGSPPTSPTKPRRSSSDGDLPVSPPALPTPPFSPTKRPTTSPHLILPNANLVANMTIRQRHKDRATKPRHLRPSSGSGSCAGSESNSGSVDEEKQKELEEEMGRKMFCPRWEVSRPKRSSPLSTAVSTSTTLQVSP